MYLTPLPGVSCDNLLTTMRQIKTDASNLRSAAAGKPPFQVYYPYLEWVDQAVRMLDGLVRADDIRRLLQTRVWELLLTTTDASVVRLLMDRELDERVRDLARAIADLQHEVERWTRSGELVVPDTSFYLTHPNKLEDADFAEALNLQRLTLPLHVVVPLVTVDELDRLKERGLEHARWRARYTVGVLGRLLAGRDGVTPLRPAAANRGRVVIELLRDPHGHTRLPDEDSEIIDRALSVQITAGRPVTLLTYDTGQQLRAEQAGIRVVKLAHPFGSEPKGPGHAGAVAKQRT